LKYSQGEKRSNKALSESGKYEFLFLYDRYKIMVYKYKGLAPNVNFEEIIPEGIKGAKLQEIILEEATNLGYLIEEQSEIHKQYWPFWPFRRSVKIKSIAMKRGQTKLDILPFDPERDYHSFQMRILGLDGARPPSPEYEKHMRSYAELGERIGKRLGI
jgi:hypothetical protein